MPVVGLQQTNCYPARAILGYVVPCFFSLHAAGRIDSWMPTLIRSASAGSGLKPQQNRTQAIGGKLPAARVQLSPPSSEIQR